MLKIMTLACLTLFARPALAQFVKKDKLGHFAVGLSFSFGGGVAKQPKLGLAAGILWGVGKEVSDHQANIQARRSGQPEPHSVEAADLGATALGAVAGYYLNKWFANGPLRQWHPNSWGKREPIVIREPEPVAVQP